MVESVSSELRNLKALALGIISFNVSMISSILLNQYDEWPEQLFHQPSTKLQTQH
jgi:hypothetical protein